MTRPRHPILQGAALAGAAALLVLAACEMPQPTAVVMPEQAVPLERIRSTSAALAPERGVTMDQVREVVRATMPELLERSSGEPVMLWVVADAEGGVLRVERQRLRRPGPVESVTADAAASAASRERAVVGVLRRERAGDGDAATFTAGIDPDVIASVEILKLAAGRVTVDSANVVWVRLKPGAVLDKEPAGAVGRVRMRQAAPATAAQLEETVVRGEARERRTSDAIVAVRAAGADRDSGRTHVRVALGTGEGPQPLFVIDGVLVPSDDARLRELPPEEIASIEVVKGAAAERLYGAEGRNGAVHITTKVAAAPGAAPAGVKVRSMPPR